jgi:CRISPR/Cas system-associated exonuclease Cas4 (RecB family)
MIKAWSPSRLVDYECCPAKAKYKYVEKLPEPPAEALDRGTRIHKLAEEFIIGAEKKVPGDLARVGKEMKRLQRLHKKDRVRVEQSLALNDSWKPVDWFSRDAWLRCKIDVVEVSPTVKNRGKIFDPVSALVTDWKTGKNNERDSRKHGDQLNLYAVAVLSTDIATRVRARLIFTDTGEEVCKPEGTMGADDVLTAREIWESRVEPMLSDKTFDPTPNFTCRWCSFAKGKGGPCRFG